MGSHQLRLRGPEELERMRVFEAKDRFLEGIRALANPVTDYVVVHSRMGSFVEAVDPFAGAIQAWKQFSDDTGATICFATYTFAANAAGVFDVESSKSESGELGMRFLQAVPGAQRTEHPMHSYVVYGPRKHEVLGCQGEDCYGEGSTFELFAREPTTVVTFGLDLYWVSFYHYLEAKFDVPYRFHKPFTGVIRSQGVERPYRIVYFARKLHLGVEVDFHRVSDAIKQRGRYRFADVLGTRCEATSAREILDVQTELMNKDILFPLVDPEAYQANAGRMRFSFLSSDNLDIFAKVFDAETPQWLRERTKVLQLPFGTYRTELLKPYSLLHEYDLDYVVFAEQTDALFGSLLPSLLDREVEPARWQALVQERVDEYAALIRRARETLNAHIIVFDFAPPLYSPLGFADLTEPHGLTALVGEANRILSERLNGISNCRFFKFSEVVRRFGLDRVRDDKFWYDGRVPFSLEFSQYLSVRLIGYLMAALGRTARVVVLDLDDTLWHGHVGEEGATVGGDFPGNCYRQFQEQLLLLNKRGVLLAICSKNTESIALRMLNEHEGMILRPQHFAAMRINWEDKARNIQEISRELNLGLASVCFLDDSIHERAMVRELLPQVLTPDFPEDPSKLPRFLDSLPCLEVVELTPEDLMRSTQQAQQARVREARASAMSVEQFLDSLNMVLYVGEWSQSNSARTVQLIQKTNQFNTTTRRFTLDDLDELCKNGHSVYTFGLSDKFSEKEFIGSFVVEWPNAGGGAVTIKLFVMSCRVMERRVEDAILGWFCVEVQRRGFFRVRGEIVETERNGPARSLFLKNGFTEVGPNLFEIDLRHRRLAVPKFIAVRGLNDTV